VRRSTVRIPWTVRLCTALAVGWVLAHLPFAVGRCLGGETRPGAAAPTDLLQQVRQRQQAADTVAAWRALASEGGAAAVWLLSPRAAQHFLEDALEAIMDNPDVSLSCRCDLVWRLHRPLRGLAKLLGD
jgi:hypothetical protein